MVVQSNRDANEQQLYRKEDNTGDLLLGAAAVGGLAYLLMKGRGAKGAKGLAGDAKSSEAVGGAVAKGNQPAKLEEAVEAINQTKAPDLKSAEYSNGQQYIVDNMLGQIEKGTKKPLAESLREIKQKANLKNSVEANGEATHFQNLRASLPENFNQQVKDTYEQMIKDKEIQLHHINSPEEYYDILKNNGLNLDDDQLTGFINQFNGKGSLQVGDTNHVFVDKDFISKFGETGEDIVNHEMGYIVNRKLFGDTRPDLVADLSKPVTPEELHSLNIGAWNTGAAIGGKDLDLEGVNKSLNKYLELGREKLPDALDEIDKKYGSWEGPKKPLVVEPDVKPLTRDDVKTVNINDVINDNKKG